MASGFIEIEIDGDQIFRDVNASTQVEAGVMKRATEISAKARRIDAKENGGRANISIRPRHFPTGRFGVDVESDDADGEYGTSERKRISTLRRAAKGR